MAEPAPPSSITLDISCEAGDWEAAAPGFEPLAQRVADTVAETERATGLVDVILLDDAEMQALNARTRGLDKPTNVLAFPAAETPQPGARHFGDLALALETIQREAGEQGKSFEAHAAHMIAHGLLHLLGHDHMTDSDADRMEARERAVLARLGISDPYLVDGAAQ